MPKQLYLVSSQGKFLMKQLKKNRFSARIQKLNESLTYQVSTNEFSSQKQLIRVTKKSVIGVLNAICSYPKYLNKAPQTIQNAGDLNLPEGTEIQWQLRAKNTKSITVSWNGQLNKFNSDICSFQKKLHSDVKLSFILTNQETLRRDTTTSRITVVKDAYPIIEVTEQQDSIFEGRKYFNGSVRDDYGLNNLQFVYTIESASGQKRTEKMAVRNVKGTAQNFDFAVDFKREKIQLEDVIKYYFVVSDNDGVNGSKSTRSQVNTYELPNLEELNEQRQEEQSKQIDDLQDILKKSQDFQKDIQQLKKESLQNKNTNWNKLNKVQELKQQQEQLQNQLKELDPESFASLEIENPHRLIRALEICIGTGKPYSSFLKKKTNTRNFTPIIIGLEADREVMYDRIEQRVDIMMNEGLLKEVETVFPHKNLNAGDILIGLASSGLHTNGYSFSTMKNF